MNPGNLGHSTLPLILNLSWIFIRRTDPEDEAPILWPPDVKSWVLRKDPDAGKDWKQEDKGMTDGWMVSLTQWTWVWASSGRCWRTGRPRVLQSTGSQRVRHDWVTEQLYPQSKNKKEMPTDLKLYNWLEKSGWLFCVFFVCLFCFLVFYFNKHIPLKHPGD